MLPKKIIAAFICFFVSGCSFATENPLIGSWKMDPDKTLKEFKSPAGSESLNKSGEKAKETIKCFANRSCGSVVLIYSAKEYTTVIFDSKGNKLSSVSAPYKVIEVGNNYVVTDQYENGGVAKAYFEGNSFYVDVKVDDYTYRDYFTKF